MPTATYPPRCPHRVATIRPNYWLTLLLASLLGSTTATESLCGQETSLLDYRFVVLTGHMQPWPDDEPDIFISPPTPVLAPTTRIAAKWQTNLRPKRDEKTSSEASKLSGPVLRDSESEVDKESEVEVLVVPSDVPRHVSKKAATEKQAKIQVASPTASTPDCYQAPPLSALSVRIALPTGKLPTNAAAQCAIENKPTGDARLVGAWPLIEHHWSATCSRHRPLYFEEINAERYGYTVSYALQPVLSAAHFFGTIPALPYKMAIDHPRDCIYTLGHYRPGSCVPRRASHLPWQPTAAGVEAGLIAGLILLVP
ncbi:MAG: hypothetical protein GXP24_02905 [Planctomycetes bacterium]|nr:hypothetical protein [Planctomycetota bacterium]